MPDLGHSVKCNNNEFFALREKDPSFRGKHALSNVRIKSIQSDITAAIKAYAPYVGDSVKRNECLNQIRAIVRHHCGDHSLCFQEKFCSYLEIKSKHEDWTQEQINAEALKRTKRHKTQMDLSEKGICILEQIIEKRFNEKTIDKHAQCGCSNSCEGFWGQLIRLSKGKRIQGCGTDLWLSMVQLCFCMNGKGNVEKTREDLSRLVNVFFTSVEREEGNTKKRLRDAVSKSHTSELGKIRRQRRKLTSDHRSGKGTNKGKHHKTEKVPLKKSSKSSVDKCSKCGQLGHKTRQCIVIKKPKKVKRRLFKWGGKICSQEKHEPRLKRHKPKMYD